MPYRHRNPTAARLAFASLPGPRWAPLAVAGAVVLVALLAFPTEPWLVYLLIAAMAWPLWRLGRTARRWRDRVGR